MDNHYIIDDQVVKASVMSPEYNMNITEDVDNISYVITDNRPLIQNRYISKANSMNNSLSNFPKTADNSSPNTTIKRNRGRPKGSLNSKSNSSNQVKNSYLCQNRKNRRASEHSFMMNSPYKKKSYSVLESELDKYPFFTNELSSQSSFDVSLSYSSPYSMTTCVTTPSSDSKTTTDLKPLMYSSMSPCSSLISPNNPYKMKGKINSYILLSESPKLISDDINKYNSLSFQDMHPNINNMNTLSFPTNSPIMTPFLPITDKKKEIENCYNENTYLNFSPSIIRTNLINVDRCVLCGQTYNFNSKLFVCSRKTCQSSSTTMMNIFVQDIQECIVCLYQSQKRSLSDQYQWHFEFRDDYDGQFVRMLRDSLPCSNGLFIEISKTRQPCWRRKLLDGTRKHFSFRFYGGIFESRLEALENTKYDGIENPSNSKEANIHVYNHATSVNSINYSTSPSPNSPESTYFPYRNNIDVLSDTLYSGLSQKNHQDLHISYPYSDSDNVQNNNIQYPVEIEQKTKFEYPPKHFSDMKFAENSNDSSGFNVANVPFFFDKYKQHSRNSIDLKDSIYIHKQMYSLPNLEDVDDVSHNESGHTFGLLDNQCSQPTTMNEFSSSMNDDSINLNHDCGYVSSIDKPNSDVFSNLIHTTSGDGMISIKNSNHLYA